MSTHFSPKAGFIPYMVDPKDGQFKMLFMVASDPRYGGPRPMISKGTIEPNEDILTAALREATEELGLKRENLKNDPFKLWEGFVALKTSKYDLSIYAAEIKDKSDFDKWESETLYATWMTNESFQEKGRRDHKPIVQLLYDKIVK